MNTIITVQEAELLGHFGVSTTKNEKALMTFKWAAEIVRTSWSAITQMTLIKRCKNEPAFRELVETVGIIDAARMDLTADKLKGMPE